MELIEYGKVLAPHGRKGELRVRPFSGEADNLTRIKTFYAKRVGAGGGELTKVVVKAVRYTSGPPVVKFAGIETRETAGEFKGAILYVDRSELPPTGEDEYYWFELIGLRVTDERGMDLGRVKGLIDRALQPVLVIEREGREYHVPFIDVFVKKVDLESSLMVIEPVEGLID